MPIRADELTEVATYTLEDGMVTQVEVTSDGFCMSLKGYPFAEGWIGGMISKSRLARDPNPAKSYPAESRS